jgi:hypothetical protein
MESSPRFCGHCGAALPKDVRFCTQCGRAVQAAQSAPEAETTPSASSPAPCAQMGERVLGILPSLSRSMGFMGLKQEAYNLIITPQRLVFAAMSNDMMKQAIAEARDKAKEQGKGFMGQWGAQMGWLQIVVDRYAAMSPDEILRQYPGSFALPLDSVRQVRIRQPHTDDDEPAARPELHLDTSSGKFRFTMGTSARDAHNLLRQHLGALVK